MQERVALKHFTIGVVKTKDNVADVLTKSLSGPDMDRHLTRLGMIFPEGRSGKQKRLLAGNG